MVQNGRPVERTVYGGSSLQCTFRKQYYLRWKTLYVCKQAINMPLGNVLMKHTKRCERLKWWQVKSTTNTTDSGIEIFKDRGTRPPSVPMLSASIFAAGAKYKHFPVGWNQFHCKSAPNRDVSICQIKVNKSRWASGTPQRNQTHLSYGWMTQQMLLARCKLKGLMGDDGQVECCNCEHITCKFLAKIHIVDLLCRQGSIRLN